MRVLFLTHAHLKKDGLSPVSCERADGFAYIWKKELEWDLDIVHTLGTKWYGPWGGGETLGCRIIEIDPNRLLFEQRKFVNLFSEKVKKLDFYGILITAIERLYTHLSIRLQWLSLDFVKARLWGGKIHEALGDKKYDFIFLSVGNGDEYLMEAGFVISKKLNTPLVIDFRDLYAYHHAGADLPDDRVQKRKKYELKIFKQAILISTPQSQDVEILNTYSSVKVLHVSHCYYVDPTWKVEMRKNPTFTITYIGKLYSNGEGYPLFLKFVAAVQSQYGSQMRVKVFTNEPEKLEADLTRMNLMDSVDVFGWQPLNLIWAELLRSDMILIYNQKISGGRSLLPTKSFISAASGAPLLFLYSYFDTAVSDFLLKYKCGVQTESVDEAMVELDRIWASRKDKSTNSLNLSIPTRKEVSLNFAAEILKLDLSKAS